MKIFLYSSVYCCHFFLITSVSVQAIPFLSFTEPIFAWNTALVSLIFLNRSLIFPILFSSISLNWSQRKSFLSLLAILWNSAFKWVYLSFSPLHLASLLSSAICKAFSDNLKYRCDNRNIHRCKFGCLVITSFSLNQMCQTTCILSTFSAFLPLSPNSHKNLSSGILW